MRIIAADQLGSLEEGVRGIRNGGVIAHPTETCYGFACDLTNREAVERLFALKGRPLDLPVSALFATVADAKGWVEWNETAEELARKHLPGPLTIVLGLRDKDKERKGVFPCPQSFVLGPHTLAVRVSSHPVARQLSARCGVPLSTTSANLHGQPEPYSAGEIAEQFSGRDLQPELILDSGTLEHVPPSTVVALENGRMRIVRQGPVPI